ncbi:MAG TPA: MBL fold metallo-hydrolase [Vicinamibacterales bacterium]|nr:MBL fold metallo-hydrolase [Vicinamibacterales bacterium]
MKKLLCGIACVMAAAIVAAAQNTAVVDKHVAAARAAGGTEHAAMVDRLCPMPGAKPAAGRGGTGQGGGRRGGGPPAPPPRESWYAEPAKVFDNLYFVGMTEFTAWAIPTSAGIIVIDPVFDYSVEASVVEGLKKLGFNPADIRYVLVSHGHLDHAGGAKLLQERFGARVLMGEADWEMVERQKPSWLPKRDMIVTDGQRLTLGDTTITMYLTPGHTDGTVSTFIPVRDGNRRHLAFLWGGTAFNFGPDAKRFAAYAASAARMRDLVTKLGADVLLSNHTDFDGTKVKLPALARRAPGAPHPYVVGTDSVRGYLTVAHECAQAALASL